MKLMIFLFLLVSVITSCQANYPMLKDTEIPKMALNSPKVSLDDDRGNLIDQGQTRTYYIYTPKSYRPNHPLPLVLAFHGYGSQGKDLAKNTGFNELAEQKGFIIVYPDGIDRSWNLGGRFFNRPDDVDFVKGLITHISQVRAIDQRKIYAVGVSNGGFLVQSLACQINSPIVAFASVAATLPGYLRSQCHPEKPVSILMINGTEDRKVPWSGGQLSYGEIVSVPDTINGWIEHNACANTSGIKQVINPRVEITHYPQCRLNSEVELVTLVGAGHIWPRGGSGPNALINGSQEIWNFFQRHSF